MPRAPGERAAGFDRATWFAYAGGATAGYLAYTIGAVAPYADDSLPGSPKSLLTAESGRWERRCTLAGDPTADVSEVVAHVPVTVARTPGGDASLPDGQAYRRPDGRPSSSLARRRAETRVIA